MCLHVLVQPRHLLYKPKQNNLVNCVDPVCAAMHLPGKPQCKDPKEQCDYKVNYADQGSSLGVIVKDSFPLRLINGSNIAPRLAFGWVSVSLHQSGQTLKFQLGDSFEHDVNPKCFVFHLYWNENWPDFCMARAWSENFDMFS